MGNVVLKMKMFREMMQRRLYEIGKELLYENEYYEIGMDHFALKTDSLYSI